MTTSDATRHARDWGRLAMWGLLVIASLGSSAALACAAPFAALGAVAALYAARREALAVVLSAWLANQLVGFLLLGYPRSWDSFAWGAALAVAAMAAPLTAGWVARLLGQPGTAVGAIGALVGAFVGFEAVLVAAAFVLPGSWEAFAPWLVARIFAMNALFFAGLILLCRVAVAMGLLAVGRDSRATAPLAA
ncbi:MAG: hypothetical protein IT562_02425 [Alphaproteobacteria bacterium]|nr:hypothetical protein [Alphaproteobacteria bacterium]